MSEDLNPSAVAQCPPEVTTPSTEPDAHETPTEITGTSKEDIENQDDQMETETSAKQSKAETCQETVSKESNQIETGSVITNPSAMIETPGPEQSEAKSETAENIVAITPVLNIEQDSSTCVSNTPVVHTQDTDKPTIHSPVPPSDNQGNTQTSEKMSMSSSALQTEAVSPPRTAKPYENLSEDTLKDLETHGFLDIVKRICQVPNETESDRSEDEGPPAKKPMLQMELKPKTTALKTSLLKEADYTKAPRLIGESFTGFHKSLSEGNFLKGCKWSPDGSAILTNSNDNLLRTFFLPDSLAEGYVHDVPDLEHRKYGGSGGVIYDFEWMPTSPADNQPLMFAWTSRDGPIHLYDVAGGQRKATYRAIDQNDELTAAHSLAFSPDGQLLYSGYNKHIRVFRTDRPGRQCDSRRTFKKEGQPGIISCIAVNPSMPTIYAAGSYSRQVALYTEPQGNMMCMFMGQAGGVTFLKFSPDGSKLYTGGRKDNEILCWDMRSPGVILYTLERKVHTNQRMYFDLDSTGRYLISGMHDGSIRVWDTLAPPVPSTVGGDADPVLPPMLETQMHGDTLNGVSCHPSEPLLATTSGQRHFPIPSGIESSDDDDYESDRDNSLRLWWCGKWTEGTVNL